MGIITVFTMDQYGCLLCGDVGDVHRKSSRFARRTRRKEGMGVRRERGGRKREGEAGAVVVLRHLVLAVPGGGKRRVLGEGDPFW